MRWFDRVRKSSSGASAHKAAGCPLPPFDLLDRSFRMEDTTEIKVIGWQYGGKFLRVPFLVRCRVLDNQEIVLVDPEFIRNNGTDVTRFPVVCEAFRKPYVSRSEEIVRLVGWESGIATNEGQVIDSSFKRVFKGTRGEEPES